MRIDYDGRQFRKLESTDGVVAVYHQRDDLVWADFAGGPVRKGSVNGTVSEDGTLRLAYTMVLAGGEVIAGHSTNTPEEGADGELLLREEWERYGPHAETGVSYLSEVTERQKQEAAR
ncbi:hypothetical protein F4556_000392 [Kitasatospora gansuensis]|uniref:Uncharacterized protein n=1 Tax=Kitasatospora gansuensis TaxID=258050 RepID=A0A7W7S7A2_9ACTN|nr:hypothetical protein [Kitasatospora gansuensis]MBB4944857.1 hypothetical protein [Kitasatospora gansuensis]